MEFIKGRCYTNLEDESVPAVAYICKRSVFRGMVLAPYKSFGRALSINSPGKWVDCTEQVRRTDALKECDYYKLVPITGQLVGTVIALHNDKYKEPMSRPYFLYAYANGIAYVMTLDGLDETVAIHAKKCYPLQELYRDIATRAVTEDPMQSSMFDGFFRWLCQTDQYRSFVNIVEDQDIDSREDMIRLFELMSFEGVTAATFEQKVDAVYSALPESKKAEALTKYSAVLAAYTEKKKTFSKVDKEIMRRTNLEYTTPQDAWAACGGGKPYPKSLLEIEIETPPTPHQYICDKLGLYDGNSEGFWLGVLSIMISERLDMDTQYKEGVRRYLEVCPEFGMEQLSFIEEEDKLSVIQKFGTPTDPDDPYRSWTNNPSPVLRALKEANPRKSYVELARDYYRQERDLW